jgi:transposase
MARYKNYSYAQTVMLPIRFDQQILPGSFEEAIDHMVDNYINLSVFESKYKNDKTGATAFNPSILLKIVLLAYSRGITSSRKIEELCNENIVFIAISADSHPDHSTIAAFISSMEKEIASIFINILMMCEEMGLIGGTMFAIDGCKLPSNASKEWSGTKADFLKKKEKIEKTVKYLMIQHQEKDKEEIKKSDDDDSNKRIKNLKNKIEKITKWINENEDKKGTRGSIIKSNITDNESAKMPSSHGVIQGYNGIAIADKKHQVIVNAEAYGEGSEQRLLKEVLNSTEENLKAIGKDEDYLKEGKLIADSGYHSKENIHMIYEKGLDAYIPDYGFRKRDPRFETAKRHRQPIDRHKTRKARKYFAPENFTYDKKKKKLICPSGCEMYIRNRHYECKGRKAIAYMAKITDCRVCELRKKCLRNPKTAARQVHIFYDHEGAKDSLLEEMKKKIDSSKGRHIYSKRMGIIEPVFGNIKNNLGLNRFTLRGKQKINIQWKLFAIIHNIGKIYRYGTGFA